MVSSARKASRTAGGRPRMLVCRNPAFGYWRLTSAPRPSNFAAGLGRFLDDCKFVRRCGGGGGGLVGACGTGATFHQGANGRKFGRQLSVWAWVRTNQQ